MDIEGMGIKWGEYLIQQGLIRDVADIYYLKREHLARLNLLDVIEAAKARPFEDALAGSGIPTVGKKSAGIIAERFADMGTLSVQRDGVGHRRNQRRQRAHREGSCSSHFS